MLSADYITPDWRRQALVLGCVPFSEQHSSSNIADWLTKQLNDWNLTAVTELIVSDTASNQMGIFNLELAPHLPRHLKPVRCACHVLQLCIDDVIFKRADITRIVKACRKICTHGNISINFCNHLRDVQEALNSDAQPLLLRQDVQTRWNSTYLMLERFLVLKPALLELLAKQEYKAHHKVLQMVKERDWSVMANVVSVLKIFYEITLQLSHASACLSEVIPCVTMLARSLERTGGPEEDGVRMFKDDLRAAVLQKEANRLGDFEDNEVYIVSTLCDPRFKDSFFLNEGTGQQAKDFLKTLVEAELESLGANNNAPAENLEAAQVVENASILHNMRKRICLDRERQLEVNLHYVLGLILSAC